MNNMETIKNLTEGTFVKITGMEVKNDNDIFVVDCDYRIEGKYAICKNERCLKKVKLNGELSSTKYNIVFLNEKTFKNNPNAKIEIVTDLKKAKKEVNNWLKGVNDEEIVVTYEKVADQTIVKNCIIRFAKGLTFGFFGEKHISKDSIFVVAGCEKTLWLQKLGQNGQVLSLSNSDNSFNFSEGLYAQAVNGGYIEVVEKIETKKGELNNTVVVAEKEIQESNINNDINIINEVAFVEEVKEISMPEAIIEIENNITEEPITEDSTGIQATVNFNTEKNGIELSFTEKPSREVLENLKSNGFRWSKFNSVWYTKDTETTRKFLKSMGFLTDSKSESSETTITESTITNSASENKEITYPEIDINDIETYKISKELSQRENSVAMFRSKDTDHEKEIQNTMQRFNNMITAALTGNTNNYIEYKAKEGLQRFKKKYYDIQVRLITHRANNPSWAYTGRSGLNVSRYNKRQSQYEKMMGESVQIYNDFEAHVKKIKNMVEAEIKQRTKEEIKQNINSVKELPKFEKIKIKYNIGAVDNIFDNGNTEKIVNTLNGYYIFNNWGCWRVYNSKGKEVFSTNTTGTLKEAQQWLIFHLSKQQITA